MKKYKADKSAKAKAEAEIAKNQVDLDKKDV